jgi:hypothetical protein
MKLLLFCDNNSNGGAAPSTTVCPSMQMNLDRAANEMNQI